MHLRVITLRYADTLNGFPEDAVREACAGRELLELREQFFVHGNVPHLLLVLMLGEEPRAAVTRQARGPDPGEDLPEHLRGLYRDLRVWRNEQAKAEGIPSYTIMRNVQVAEICRKLPRTAGDLKTIDGIGEATAAKYGEAILGLLASVADAQPPEASE